MIRVLQAEESLRHVTEIAAGNGLIEKPQREQILSRWRRDAKMGERKAEKVTLDSLIGNGIGLQIIHKGASVG